MAIVYIKCLRYYLFIFFIGIEDDDDNKSSYSHPRQGLGIRFFEGFFSHLDIGIVS